MYTLALCCARSRAIDKVEFSMEHWCYCVIFLTLYITMAKQSFPVTSAQKAIFDVALTAGEQGKLPPPLSKPRAVSTFMPTSHQKGSEKKANC